MTCVEVFVGLDVGKGTHHAVALDRKRQTPLGHSALPNDESKLRALIGKLKEHGQSPACRGSTRHRRSTSSRGGSGRRRPGLHICRDLAMRRIADLHAGESKTDARDAYIIAEAARSMPHTLRSMKMADNEVAELTMLCGFDEDLAGPDHCRPAIASAACLTQIHPALERVARSASGSPRNARSDRALSRRRRNLPSVSPKQLG